MKTVNHNDIMKLGFSKTASKEIIKQAKQIAINQFDESLNSSNNMVKLSRLLITKDLILHLVLLWKNYLAFNLLNERN